MKKRRRLTRNGEEKGALTEWVGSCWLLHASSLLSLPLSLFLYVYYFISLPQSKSMDGWKNI
jgi:ABC-type phosphate transport system permease subunit